MRVLAYEMFDRKKNEIFSTELIKESELNLSPKPFDFLVAHFSAQIQLAKILGHAEDDILLCFVGVGERE